jgi:hypothetical protein
VLGTSQATAAAVRRLYVDDVLEAQGIATRPQVVMPGAFAGIASDGRPLATLLLEPGHHQPCRRSSRVHLRRRP